MRFNNSKKSIAKYLGILIIVLLIITFLVFTLIKFSNNSVSEDNKDFSTIEEILEGIDVNRVDLAVLSKLDSLSKPQEEQVIFSSEDIKLISYYNDGEDMYLYAGGCAISNKKYFFEILGEKYSDSFENILNITKPVKIENYLDSLNFNYTLHPRYCGEDLIYSIVEENMKLNYDDHKACEKEMYLSPKLVKEGDNIKFTFYISSIVPSFHLTEYTLSLKVENGVYIDPVIQEIDSTAICELGVIY